MENQCPGFLSHWNAHPSPANAGHPFSLVWQDHHHSWELPSLALPCSFSEATGGVILFKLLHPQTLLSRLACSSHSPATTLSPLTQGCSSPTLGQGLAFTSGIFFLWMKGPLGFLAASCSVCYPLFHPMVGAEQAEKHLQFFFAFPRTCLHMCGARPCLSSQVLAHTLPPVSSPYITTNSGVALVREWPHPGSCRRPGHWSCVINGPLASD